MNTNEDSMLKSVKYFNRQLINTIRSFEALLSEIVSHGDSIVTHSITGATMHNANQAVRIKTVDGNSLYVVFKNLNIYVCSEDVYYSDDEIFRLNSVNVKDYEYGYNTINAVL